MPLKNLGHQDNASRRWYIWEAHQACMLNFPYIDKLPEVGIDRHQYSAFGGGAVKERPVARIGSTLQGLDVMPLGAQPFRQTTASATIDKESHDSATDTAASVSLAMTACAYAAHARMSSGSNSG